MQQTERWMSVLGGTALVITGARRFTDDRPGQAALFGALGAGLLWRGGAGHPRAVEMAGIHTAERRDSTGSRSGGRVEQTKVAVTIERPADELYRVWRSLDNIPRFLPSVVSVETVDQRRSRWIARGPGRFRVKWIAELVNDVPGKLIAWRTVGDPHFVSAGSIQFTPASSEGGTVVVANVRYDVPGGKVGAALASIFGEDPAQVLREGLRRFKQIMEAGEVPTIDGQPRGGR